MVMVYVFVLDDHTVLSVRILSADYICVTVSAPSCARQLFALALKFFPAVLKNVLIDSQFHLEATFNVSSVHLHSLLSVFEDLHRCSSIILSNRRHFFDLCLLLDVRVRLLVFKFHYF